MHRGHRHTDCTADPWTVVDRVDSVEWTHTERHLESTDTQRPGSGWKTGVKKRHLDVDTVTHSFTWTMGTS